MNKVKVFAPATIANVGCGFDVLGLALHEPGDVVEVKLNDKKILQIENCTNVDLPMEPERNVTTVAIKAMLDALQSNQGCDVIFHTKIHPGSGIGSSAASSVAGIFGLNELLNKPFTRKELVRFAMEGERIASGAAHADNVAPALLGGFTLVRSYTPLDIYSIPSPDELYCTVVHPDIEVKTKDSRMIIKKMIPLKDAIIQWGNVAGLITGLFTSNYELIGNSLTDIIVEPIRSLLIPEFYKVKNIALEMGALGCSISGSGPSMFALSKSNDQALKIGDAMKSVFTGIGIESNVYTSKINKTGVKVID